jgi:cyclophilin family peptidyl-prolyl cis-trans isomerase
MKVHRSLILLLVSLYLIPVAGCGQETQQFYSIDTPNGRMVAMMYGDTPIHQANFDSLVSEAFFDSTTFHRVISGFMIQGGDPNSKDTFLQDDGGGGPGYTIPAEFTPARYHKRGAIAAARLGDDANPARESSGSQFYIVHGGTPIAAPQLAQMEEQLRSQRRNPDFTFSEEARAAYIRSGGAPQLDGEYTVFGEIVEGFEVLDSIADVRTHRRRWQEQDPTLQNDQIDPAIVDQPPERIWMTVRPLRNYQPSAQ